MPQHIAVDWGFLLSPTSGLICQISPSWVKDVLLSSLTLCPRHAAAVGPDLRSGVIYSGDWDTFCG